MQFQIKQFNLNNADILKSLVPRDQNALLVKAQQKKFKSGKAIYREGHKPNGVYILKKGKVKVYQTAQNGQRQTMYIYTPGELFGYRPIISNEMHPVTAVALEESTCDFIPRAHFLSCVQNSPVLSNALLVSLSHEFSVWVNTISVFARYPVKSRVALALLVLQEKFRTKEKSNEVTLSRSELASYIGTVKEMVVRVVQELKKDKIVETQGSKIKILKPEELKMIVNFY